MEAARDEDQLATVIELLHGIGGKLMSIDGRLEDIVDLLRGEEDGEEEADA